MSRKRLVSLIVVLSTILICVLASTGIVWFGIPGLAAYNFGPPADGLSTWQRLYLSSSLVADAGALSTPFNADGTTQHFEVTLGESPLEITQRLQQQGLIPNAEALLNYIIYTGLDTTIQAGDYALNPASTPIQIAASLQDATPKEITFTILPGWRLEEIAQALPTSGLSITPTDFLQAASRPLANSPIIQYLPQTASLEGFLPPGSYQLPRETKADELVTYLTNRFIAQLNPELVKAIHNQDLDLYQAVILASIVEREAVLESEMPLIASVFANRLAAGMKLETDPSVQYALGYDPESKSWWKNPLSQVDLKINSPYNTYLHPGLPPGPISSPSLEALKAVAKPAGSPYYYFRAKCDGSGEHFFSETFEEHLRNECK